MEKVLKDLLEEGYEEIGTIKEDFVKYQKGDHIIIYDKYRGEIAGDYKNNQSIET